MVISIIIFIISSSYFLNCILGSLPHNPSVKNKIIVGLISVIVCFGALSWGEKADKFWNSEYKRVAPFYDKDNFSKYNYILQEVDSKKYFVVENNLWNPINPTYREYLDTEIVEEYIKAYEIVTTLKLLED